MAHHRHCFPWIQPHPGVHNVLKAERKRRDTAGWVGGCTSFRHTEQETGRKLKSAATNR